MERAVERVRVVRTGPYSERIGQQLLQLHLDDEHADLSIHTPGKSFKCHKIILAANSLYFKNMLRFGMNEMKLERVSSDVFQCLLKYFYTGEVDIPDDLLVPLIHATDFLRLAELQEICLREAVKVCKPANAVSIHQLAKTHGLRELRDKAEYIIATSLSLLVELESFVELSEWELRDVLDVCEEQNSDADDMYEAVMRWIEHDREQRVEAISSLMERFDVKNCSIEGMHQVMAKHHTLGMQYDNVQLQLNSDHEKILGEEAEGLARQKRWKERHPRILIVGEQDSWGGVQKLCWGWEHGGLTEKLELPPHGSNFGACVTPSGFAVTGGEGCQLVSAYNAGTKRWGRLAELPVARQLHGMACVGNKLFILGGRIQGETTPSVQFLEMNSATSNWRDGPGIPSGGVERPQIIATRRGFYLLDVITPDFFYYDVTLSQWSTLSCLNRYEPGARMVRAGKELVVAGGKVTLRYNIQRNTWLSFYNPANCCQNNPAVVFAENMLWVFGDPKDNCVWRYHISTKTWSKSSLKVPHNLRNLHALTLHL